MQTQNFANLIEEQFKNEFESQKLNDNVIDYVLKCTKGIYKGNYLYLNLTQSGEIIGSSQENDVTLTIDDAEIAPKHCYIKAEIDEDSGRINYILGDLKSGQATWVKIRNDIPVLVSNNMEIKIGKLIYKLQIIDKNIKEAQEWLSFYDMSYLEKVFEENKIFSIKDIQNLTEEQITQLFEHYDLDSNKIEQFLQNHSEISNQWPSNLNRFTIYIYLDGFIRQQLNVLNMNANGDLVLNLGWQGATISSKTYVYQKPPEKLINKHDFDDYEENPFFELIIRYLYGKYVLQTWKSDNYNIFFKLNEKHSLIPDDVIKIGNLEFSVQRFNTSYALHYGSQSYQEDAVSIVNDLGVSNKVSVSCYGVFDGHNGDECVKYMSTNLFDNLREIMLKSEPSFDNQPQFLKYMYEILRKTFIYTDEEFYQDFIEDKAIWTGSVAAIAVIAGDQLITANIGDCRVVVCREGQAISLTEDHKPYLPREKQRIEKKGGIVNMGRLGKLSISRAFGDFGYKKQREKSGKNLISVKPDIRIHQIDYKKDEFMVLFSDGVIEAFNNNQNLVDFIRSRYVKNKIMEQDPYIVCREVLSYTYDTVMSQRKRSDNLSIIIVNFTRGIKPEINI